MKSNTLAVCVVRLQVPELHTGHRYLLNSMCAIHDDVLVVIGETDARLTPEDPLTFKMRADMLRALYPKVQIAPLKDQPDDHLWSQSLDKLIGEVMYLNAKMSPYPILYGGRDSFLSHYDGVFKTIELPPPSDAKISGTKVREQVEPRDTLDFRLGMIYASKHKFPISYQCVDVALMSGDQVLLGKKECDNGKWRFIGGFVSTHDASLEAAARREVREETGVEPGDATYIGSAQIDDYRYPQTGTDRLLSAFFIVDNVFGPAKAQDDLDECRWFPMDDVQGNLIPEHLPLELLLRSYLYAAE